MLGAVEALAIIVMNSTFAEDGLLDDMVGTMKEGHNRHGHLLYPDGASIAKVLLWE